MCATTRVQLITDIDDRKNYIIRKSPNLSKQSSILAANIDQAFLIVTVAHPETSTTFIDRFLAGAEAYRVPVTLVFNKTDLLDDDELRYQKMMINLYDSIGYKCIETSLAPATTAGPSATADDDRLRAFEAGIATISKDIEGKVTLLSGNSGVGKSTLINRLIPGAGRKTAEISDAHDTGMHTTTLQRDARVALRGIYHRHTGNKGFRNLRH